MKDDTNFTQYHVISSIIYSIQVFWSYPFLFHYIIRFSRSDPIESLKFQLFLLRSEFQFSSCFLHPDSENFKKKKGKERPLFILFVYILFLSFNFPKIPAVIIIVIKAICSVHLYLFELYEFDIFFVRLIYLLIPKAVICPYWLLPTDRWLEYRRSAKLRKFQLFASNSCGWRFLTP